MSKKSWAAFAKTLRAIRSDEGYASARAFYQSAGGRPFFGCTYRQYLNVENGDSAPSPQLVERISLGLRLSMYPDRAKDFITDYLQCLIVRAPLLDLIVKTLASARQRPESPGAPLRRSMVRNFKARSVPLTKLQSETATSTPENYWTFTVLANDRGKWSPQKIARVTELPLAGVKKALAALAQVKLVAKNKQGDYWSPLAGKVVLHPRDDIYAPRLERLRRHWDAMGVKKGRTVLKQHLFTRASEGELQDYTPHLVESVQSADIVSTDRHGPDTAFFLIETVVRKILPF